MTLSKSVSHIAYELSWRFESWDISNSNWTEWSTIQGVIARVISKSDERGDKIGLISYINMSLQNRRLWAFHDVMKGLLLRLKILL